ncbi:MAG: ATP/GTP-binding protein [Clostridiales bacterium]|nr:ATP/GTP-binding protein [Clostridiales bacterium]
MKHLQGAKGFEFIREPESFNKYTDKEFLQYCPGATMYMPAIKDFTEKILNRDMADLTTIVMCFEDACPEGRVPEAEENVIGMLDRLHQAVENGEIDYDDIPLIFCRVRSIDQFIHFSSMLNADRVKMLAGFNFPKFNSKNGAEYLLQLKLLNDTYGEILYGMPILEDERVAFKESRMDELRAIRSICNRYKDLILQIRVGATDFSSCFGVRRGVDYSIYDILPVREILSDILNVFARGNTYVVSGPVWEYFRASKRMMFEELPRMDVEDMLWRRNHIFNDEVDGLIREVILDKANGFVGRTVIHPTHVRFVNALQAVTEEAYKDALQILAADDGVVKSESNNKMNEIRPHTKWAEKIVMRGRAYGVIRNEKSYIDLFKAGAQQ